MLYGSDTLPVRKENEVALQQAETRMVRWTCDAKVNDRIPSKEMRERERERERERDRETETRNRYNLRTTAKQVALIWACAVQRSH